MKYSLTRELKSFDGKPFLLKDGESARNMDLRDSIRTACLNAGPEQAKTGEQKLKLYAILEKTATEEPVIDLVAEEVTLLKQVAGTMFVVALYGAFCKVLETPGA